MKTYFDDDGRLVVLDFYCGLGGWAEGLIAEGCMPIGFDIERHDYGNGSYPGCLVLQDVLTLTGRQFAGLGDRLCGIVASPPCQEPSYRAMPWSRAKALNRQGPPKKFIELFNSCFRIQREVSGVLGRHIPIVVENVRGAQRWVGKSKWHYGSYYLWGDVPALMPITFKPKVTDQDWNRFKATGEISPHWRMQGRKWEGVWFGSSDDRSLARMFPSKSKSRKKASAEIAKIPRPLAVHIARTFRSEWVAKRLSQEVLKFHESEM